MNDSDPLWQRAPLRFRASFGCLGRRLEVSATHEWLIEAGRRCFGRFAVPSVDPKPIRMSLIAMDEQAVGDSSRSFGSSPSSRRTEPGTGEPPGQMLHRERGAVYTAADGFGSCAVAELGRRRVVAFVSSASPWSVLRPVVFESPLWRVLARGGMTAVHAGSVVIEGRTFVLRGASGAGKSTLTLAAALAGHGVVAEEVTWIDEAGACLRGVPWWIRVDRTSEDLLYGPVGRDRHGDEDTQMPAAQAKGGVLSLALAMSPQASAFDDGDCQSAERTVDLLALGAKVTEVAPTGPLILLNRRHDSHASLVRLNDRAAQAEFDASVLPGELTQRPAQFMRARDLLIGQGAWRLTFSEPWGALNALSELSQTAVDS